MGTVQHLGTNLWNTLLCIKQLLGYALTFLWALCCSRAALAGRLVAAESQLAVCKHRIEQKKDPGPRFTHTFRFLWIVLSKVLPDWKSHVHMMQVATVKAWHTTAYRSPWQNPYVERFIGTLRRELLDHVIVLSQPHLERLLREFIEDYYHVARPHQGLNGDTPIPQDKPQEIKGPTKLISIPVLGGLYHRYVRVAA